MRGRSDNLRKMLHLATLIKLDILFVELSCRDEVVALVSGWKSSRVFTKISLEFVFESRILVRMALVKKQ